MSITSLRQAVLTAGGTPTKFSHVELLRQLIATWGGTPTGNTVTALLRQAISNRSGTPTQYTQIGLLRELIAALGGTPVSYKADDLWTQMAALATVGTPTLQVLNLSGGTITEGSAAGTVIGAILNTRVGSTLSLSADAGGRFALSGGNLVAGATATDYETATSHTVTVVETLAGAIGSPKSTVLTVNVTNVLDAPNLVALTGSLSVPENSANGTVVGTPTGYTAGSSKTFTADAGGRFAINSTTGQITVANGLLLDYETNTSHNVTITETLVDSPNSPRATTLTIQVTDVVEGGGGGTLLAPTVAFAAPSYLNPPNIDYTLASDVITGDWIGREYALNSAFTGATLEWHQVTDDDIINSAGGTGFSWPFAGAFADGTLYIRVYAGRGTAPGSFTNTSPASTAVSRSVYDATPNAWDFTDQTGVTASTLTASAPVTPTGYTGPITVVTNGNEVSINGGAYATADTTLSPGQSIAVRGTSSATQGATVTLTINVAGVDVTFAMTTAVAGADFVASTTQIGHQSSGYGGTVDFLAGRQVVAVFLDNTVNTITSVTIGGSATTKLGGSANNRWALYELAGGTAGNKAVVINGAGGDCVTTTGTIVNASGAGTGLTVLDLGFTTGPYVTPASLTVAANGIGVAFVAANRNSNTFTSWNNGFTSQSVKTDASQYEGRTAKKLTSGQPSISYAGTCGVAMIGIVYPG
jgi:hypothetical protein